jgi:periplasmic protein TonB
MPVYASTSGFAGHRRHPRALLLIVGGHAVLIAAVMTAKMELPDKFIPDITRVKLLPSDPPPPDPLPPPPKPDRDPRQDSRLDRPDIVIPTPVPDGPIVTDPPIPLPPNPGPTGPSVDPAPPLPTPAAPVRIGPRFITPQHLIEPLYPPDKQRLEEEAVLRLKLSIDERGRVIAVEPVGRADRSFLEAARRHLIANWRYKPATENGKAIAWSTVITLTFRIEN